MVNCIFKPNVPCPPQTIQVSVEHPNKEVTVSLEPSKLMEEFKLSALKLPAAVSYTHLDVYKRQCAYR